MLSGKLLLQICDEIQAGFLKLLGGVSSTHTGQDRNLPEELKCIRRSSG